MLQPDEEEHESGKEPPDDIVEHELPIRDDHQLSLNALKGGLGKDNQIQSLYRHPLCNSVD